MKKFVVILRRKNGVGLKSELLTKHVAHLRSLKQGGNLLLCGPFQDNERAMLILACSDREEAVRLIESDPFIQEGYYAAYDMYEWLEANEENNWLVDSPQTNRNLQQG